MHSVIEKQNEVSNLLTLSNNEIKKRVESIEENKGSQVENIAKGKNVEPKSVKEPNLSLILFRCTECGCDCASHHELARHVEVCKNRNEPSIACQQCSHMVDTNDNLILHMETHKIKVDRFTCTVCDYKCPSQELFQKHLLTHNSDKDNSVISDIVEPKFNCSECGYKAARDEDLKLHMETHKDETDSFTCTLCVYECTSKEGHVL